MIRKEWKIRAGFVGFGEVNTPREFIDGRCKTAADELRKRGIELVETAPVSDDPEGSQAQRAVEELAKGDFDSLVVCIAGWIPTWAVIKVIEPFKHKPILLWGLSGWRANGHFVTTADQAGTTALRAPMQEMGYNFKYLVNKKDAAPRYDEAAAFMRAASATARMHHVLIGMSGYRDMRLFGTLYDGNLLKRKVGAEIEHFDLMEIQARVARLRRVRCRIVADPVRRRRPWAYPTAPEVIQRGGILYPLPARSVIVGKIGGRLCERFSAALRGLSLWGCNFITRPAKIAPAASCAVIFWSGRKIEGCIRPVWVDCRADLLRQ